MNRIICFLNVQKRLQRGAILICQYLTHFQDIPSNGAKTSNIALGRGCVHHRTELTNQLTGLRAL